jgi:LuxR family maltose regulon positive regulatory protein
VRLDVVPWARLIRRVLDAQADIVVLRAPAGYGKTTLMTQCAAAAAQPVAWVSLDVLDNDPAVLLREIATATGHRDSSDVPTLLNQLARAPAMLLMIDNMELVHAPPAVETLTLLCSYLPKGWKLVVAGRQVRALPVARLRANGLALELDATELALTASEARRLLESVPEPLELSALQALYERMEGWPAGVYLASSGSQERAISEYVWNEVLAPLKANQRVFLIRTSVLDRFCPSLCNAVLGREDSAAMIAELAQTPGFVVGLEQHPTWFRYHHLLATILRERAAETDTGWLAEVHARASLWHESHGMPGEAIEHALSSGDRRRAAKLFARYVRQLTNQGDQATLRRWTQAFSDEDLADWPPAAAGAAWVLGQFGERAPTRRCITILERSECAGPFPFGERSSASAMALLKATFGWEGLSQMRALADTAYRLEPAGTEAHERSALSLGANLFLRGRLESAQQYLEEATGAVETDANTAVFALGLLALLHLESQRFTEARAALREGLMLIDEKQLQGYPTSGALFAACAYMDIQHEQPDAAAACLNRAVSLLPAAAAVPWWSILLATWTARIAIRLNDVERAEWLLSQAQRELGRFPDCGMLAQWVQKQERALEAAHGGAALLRQPLTDAELRVLELAPTHLTLEEIGRSLCISRNTVKTHLKVIYGKLSVSSRSAAVARAQAVGLIGRQPARN